MHLSTATATSRLFTNARRWLCTPFVALSAMLATATSAPAQTCGHWPGGPGSIGDPGAGGSNETTVYATAEWDPDGDGSLPRVLVAGGRFFTAGSVAASGIAVYDFATRSWFPLGSGITGGSATVRAIAVLADGSLVVGGLFQSAGGVAGTNNLARWVPSGTSVNEGEWKEFATPRPFTVALVRSLVTLANGDLLAGGVIYTSGGPDAGFNGIVRWDGTTWWPLGTGIPTGATSEVRSIAVLQDGSIVAGGKFFQAGGNQASSVARWDGTRWSSLGTPPNEGVGPVASSGHISAVACDSNGDVVVGGWFERAGSLTVRGIAKWRPSTGQWSRVGGTTSVPWIYSILPLENGAFIAAAERGPFSSSFFVEPTSVAQWDGFRWNSMNFPSPNINNGTGWCLTRLSNGNVILGGDFTTAGGSPATNIAEFDFDVEPPLIDAHPAPATACHAESVPVSFTVSAVSPIAKTYQWQRNGVDIPRTANASAATQTLTLPNPFGVDAGDYRCIVTTGCGSITSNAARLTICTADFDCSNTVTLDDVFIFLNAWFQQDPRCNVYGVSSLTLDDLFVFINIWYAGC
jgi:hypothetical protein